MPDVAVTKDEESEAMQEQFLEDEAGVADLLEFYSKVEEVYSSAMQATEQFDALHDSAATNL